MEPSPSDRAQLEWMNDLFRQSYLYFQLPRPNRSATRSYDQMAQAIKSDLLSRGLRLGVNPFNNLFYFED